MASDKVDGPVEFATFEELLGRPHRVNKKGDAEVLPVRKKRKGTLNELMDEIDDLIEDIAFVPQNTMMPEQPDSDRVVNQTRSPTLVASRGDQVRENGDTITNMTGSSPMTSDLDVALAAQKPKSTMRGSDNRDKYNYDYPGDRLDQGATHSESFTGTCAIAMPFSSYEVAHSDDEEDNDNHKPERRKMARQQLDEWAPEFKAGEYDPGDYEMPSPVGKGVATRNVKQDSTGKRDSEISHIGNAWPRKHKDTTGMCDVNDEGVVCSDAAPESTHGDAADGITSKHAHSWPKQPKNSGGGVAEPFEGSRWEDGGTLTGGHAQSEFNIPNNTQKMPKSGHISGTSGPQMGQVQEGWTPDSIGDMIGEDFDIQGLFDSFAQAHETVYLEDFQDLCDAHGLDFQVDESAFLRLMADNQDFVFYEHADNYGPFWIAEMGPGGGLPDAGLGGPHLPPEDEMGGEMGGGMGDDEEWEATAQRRADDAQFLSGGEVGQCEGCGYEGPEEECPECGQPMYGDEMGGGDPMGGLGGMDDMGGSALDDDALNDPFHDTPTDLPPGNAMHRGGGLGR